MSERTVAIMYDFDKTLCTTDMQNYAFIPNLGMTPAEFWESTEKFAHQYGVERILSYMYVMIRECQKKNIPITKEYLHSLGKDVKFFSGVLSWFSRINAYGKLRGINVEHYIISSGTKEIIEGTAIAKEFKKIYACEFAYDNQTKEAMWPAFAINYTQKTQYFFRISKGALDPKNDFDINSKTRKKRIPYSNMIYIGDGMTDVPAMILGKKNGGTSIALYPSGKKEHVLPLLKEERVNYICRADYSSNSPLDNIIKLTIDQISVKNQLSKMSNKYLKTEE
jgi:2-hydroxy-3-keto-5-methylthiopentenyl-1-phosphate phosphatase